MFTDIVYMNPRYEKLRVTTRATEILFKPFRLKGLTLKNRIVMAPTMRSFSPDGVPGEDVANYYRGRAEVGQSRSDEAIAAMKGGHKCRISG